MSKTNDGLMQKSITTYQKYKNNILQKQKDYELEQQTIKYKKLHNDISIIRDAISKHLPSDLEVYIPDIECNTYGNTWGYTESSLYVLFIIPNSQPISMTVSNNQIETDVYYRVVTHFDTDVFDRMIPKYDKILSPTKDVYLAIGRGIELKEEYDLLQSQKIQLRDSIRKNFENGLIGIKFGLY